MGAFAVPIVAAVATVAAGAITTMMAPTPEVDNSAYQAALDEQKKASNLANDQANIENRNRQIEVLNQARAQRAMLLTRGENVGGGDSSSSAGGAGSILTQANTSIATQQQMANLEKQRVTALSNSNMAMGRYQQSVYNAQQGSGLGSLMQGFGSSLISGGTKQLTTIFG